tara:strand:- start:24 stop:395 length:372 start_codon:yes stop_codon:yes gene_type:complete
MNPGGLKIVIFILFITFSSPLFSKYIENTKAEIKILDKITAKVITLEINVNESASFNSLIIEIYACYKKPPEDIPENFVLLKIYDSIIQSEEQAIYKGWMISSSPSATPLEHPIYDLWLNECK